MGMRIVMVSACAASAAVMALVSAGAAEAAPTGSSCPSGYQLVSLNFVLKQAAEGFRPAIRAADENGDKQLCYKLLPGPIPLFEPTFLYEDNVAP